MHAIKDTPLSLRLPQKIHAALSEQARRQASYPATLGAELIDLGLRARCHPAIDFETTPDGGRKARLAGRRVAVWIVADTVKALGRGKAAKHLDLPPALLAAALDYAAAYPDEIKHDQRQGTRSLAACGLEDANP